MNWTNFGKERAPSLERLSSEAARLKSTKLEEGIRKHLQEAGLRGKEVDDGLERALASRTNKEVDDFSKVDSANSVAELASMLADRALSSESKKAGRTTEEERMLAAQEGLQQVQGKEVYNPEPEALAEQARQKAHEVAVSQLEAQIPIETLEDDSEEIQALMEAAAERAIMKLAQENGGSVQQMIEMLQGEIAMSDEMIASIESMDTPAAQAVIKMETKKREQTARQLEIAQKVAARQNAMDTAQAAK